MTKPLWRVLYRAYDQSIIPPNAKVLGPEDECSVIDCYGYASEIEALADWLVPEEASTAMLRILEEDGYVPMRLAEERQLLRARLLEQAGIAREGA